MKTPAINSVLLLVFVLSFVADAAEPVGEMDFTALAANRAEWPAEVTLKQAAVFPVLLDGQQIAEIEIPAAVKVRLIEVRANGHIIVAHDNRTTEIPAVHTDLVERVTETRRARAEAERIAAEQAVQRAREAEERARRAAEEARKAQEEAAAKAQAAFLEALNKAELDKLKTLLQFNPRFVSLRDRRGATPLHWAAESGNKAAVELLLAHRADVNAKTETGATPLHYANARDVIDTLVAHGADLNAKGALGMTPLHAAAWAGHRDKVHALLTHRADVQARDNEGQTPLHCAIWSNNKDVVEMLLKRGADVNAKDNHGRTPLFLAKRWYGKDLIPLLVERGGQE